MKSSGSSTDFNSRPCVRGDQSAMFASMSARNFNSRPCVRGDRCLPYHLLRRLYFNSRPCVRGDIQSRIVLLMWTTFQFTPLREGRRISKWRLKITTLFQFTPLREGRQQKCTIKQLGCCSLLPFHYRILQNGITDLSRFLRSCNEMHQYVCADLPGKSVRNRSVQRGSKSIVDCPPQSDWCSQSLLSDSCSCCPADKAERSRYPCR